MWYRLSAVLLALTLQTSFVSKSSETLRQRYGNPISETYMARPGIVVTASYGPSGQTCELVISPKEPDLIVRKWPGSDELNADLELELEDELVPASERGKHKIDTFLDIVCLPENDCFGVESDWEDLSIYRNSGHKGPHYSKIEWKRRECQQ